MPVAYSVDLRQRIVDAYQAKEGSQRQLAERFKVSLSFVRNLLRHYRQHKTVQPKPHGGGAVASLGVSERCLIAQWLKQQPDLLLRELCERMEQERSIRVSSSTMWRVVEQLGMSVKKTFSATEAETEPVQAQRFAFRHWILSIDLRNLVFVDQAGINLDMTRLRGGAAKGERVHDVRPRNTGENISLLSAIGLKGLIATMRILGSVNTDVFVTYLLEVLLPQLWVEAIVVMDNLAVHHAVRVRQAIEAAGAKLVFLPPESPDLSPIELCWSKLKQLLCSAKARTLKSINDALTQIITQEISEENAIAWFAHCGLFV